MVQIYRDLTLTVRSSSRGEVHELICSGHIAADLPTDLKYWCHESEHPGIENFPSMSDRINSSRKLEIVGESSGSR